MAITLAEAKIGMADKVDQQIVDMFRRSSLLLDQMVFDNVISPGTGGSTLTYGYINTILPIWRRGIVYRAPLLGNKHIVDYKVVNILNAAQWRVVIYGLVQHDRHLAPCCYEIEVREASPVVCLGYCHTNLLFAYIGRALRIVYDEVCGLDNLISLLPHTNHPGVVVSNIVLVVLS